MPGVKRRRPKQTKSLSLLVSTYPPREISTGDIIITFGVSLALRSTADFILFLLGFDLYRANTINIARVNNLIKNGILVTINVINLSPNRISIPDLDRET